MTEATVSPHGASPPPELAAAIAAAVEQLLQPTAVVAEAPSRAPHTVWRFSGRWWAKPTVARRDRPWVSG